MDRPATYSPERKPPPLATLWNDLRTEVENGQPLPVASYLSALRKLIATGGLDSLEKLLPSLLRLNGKPFRLDDHFLFEPLYRLLIPRKMIWMAARQTSKTTNAAARSILLCACNSHFTSLHLTPLYDQIRRFSNQYVRPFIEESPLRALWLGTHTERSVLQRSFKNHSAMIFTFALLDANRVRGNTADSIHWDEFQDSDPDHYGIVAECMSHSDWDLTLQTGTPKSLDNPMEGAWRQSSMAEWFIPCYGCGEWNIPSLEYHLDAMIGPWHDQISERYPAVICHKCRRPIYPRQGRWVHRHKTRRLTYAGYHVPQIILPLHYARPGKWAELLGKREGLGNMTTAMFYNEVLAESVDAGQKLVSETELRQAGKLPWKNNPRSPDSAVYARLRHYQCLVLGVDWGGGGESGTSFTALALLGLTVDHKIHCLWGKRLTLLDHIKEAQELIHWVNHFQVELVAHDYTGAGTIRETVMAQAGFPLERLMPIALCRTTKRDLINFVPATPLHHREHYTLDKVRSLLYTCQAIKTGLLQFFEYDEPEVGKGLLADFLALVEEKTDTGTAGPIYKITKNTLLTDDFAQAVNLGCCALWHSHHCWPDFARAAAVGRITRSQERIAGSQNYGWNEDATMADFHRQF